MFLTKNPRLFFLPSKRLLRATEKTSEWVVEWQCLKPLLVKNVKFGKKENAQGDKKESPYKQRNTKKGICQSKWESVRNRFTDLSQRDAQKRNYKCEVLKIIKKTIKSNPYVLVHSKWWWCLAVADNFLPKADTVSVHIIS